MVATESAGQWSAEQFPPLDQLWPEIEERLGVVPAFYRVGAADPPVAWMLFRMAEFAYYDNPLPAVFKEQLSAYLSRFCEVRYCVSRHCGFLLGTGYAGGDRNSKPLGVDEVLALLVEPVPGADEMSRLLIEMQAMTPVAEWPEWNSRPSYLIRMACGAIFLDASSVRPWSRGLRALVGPARYEQLMLVLTFNRMGHFWTRVHPAIEFDSDVELILAEQEALARAIKEMDQSDQWEVGRRIYRELESLQQLKTMSTLRDANEIKDQFVSLIAHELRGPITAIYGFAEFLLGRSEQLSKDVIAESLREIRDASMRAERLLANLVMLARPELGAPAVSHLLLAEPVLAAVASQRKAAPSREIVIDDDLFDIEVSGNKEYVEQIVGNFLSNAVKYSPADKAIEIVVNRGSDEVAVSVQDRGPGVPASERDLIFGSFYRAEGAATRATGLGVGLAVCKRLAETHGGRIWYLPREAGGSEFWFTLPMSPASSE